VGEGKSAGGAVASGLVLRHGTGRSPDGEDERGHQVDALEAHLEERSRSTTCRVLVHSGGPYARPKFELATARPSELADLERARRFLPEVDTP